MIMLNSPMSIFQFNPQELDHPGNRLFETTLFLPYTVEEIFPFFAEARNLERITPPLLHFKVLSQSTPSITQGTIFDYRLKIRGVPCHWRSLIHEWEENHHFVDCQLKGPYSLWHHLHEFIPQEGGTLMRDRVIYRLPLGRFGDLAAGWFVSRDVRGIFEYREKVIKEIFPNRAETK